MGGTDFGWTLRKTSVKNQEFAYEKDEGLTIFDHFKFSFPHIHRNTSV